MTPTTVAVTGVSLDKTTASVAVGDTVQLTATIAPADATNANKSFKSSDETIATVDETGLVTGVAKGTAKITVTTEDGAQTADSDITVTAAA